MLRVLFIFVLMIASHCRPSQDSDLMTSDDSNIPVNTFQLKKEKVLLKSVQYGTKNAPDNLSQNSSEICLLQNNPENPETSFELLHSIKVEMAGHYLVALKQLPADCSFAVGFVYKEHIRVAPASLDLAKSKGIRFLITTKNTYLKGEVSEVANGKDESELAAKSDQGKICEIPIGSILFLGQAIHNEVSGHYLIQRAAFPEWLTPTIVQMARATMDTANKALNPSENKKTCSIQKGFIYKEHVFAKYALAEQLDEHYGKLLASKVSQVSGRDGACANSNFYRGDCYECAGRAIEKALKSTNLFFRGGAAAELNPSPYYAKYFALNWQEGKSNSAGTYEFSKHEKALRLKRVGYRNNGSSVAQLKQLIERGPPGTIIVWSKCSAREAGHIAIKLNSKEAASSFRAPLAQTCWDDALLAVFYPIKLQAN